MIRRADADPGQGGLRPIPGNDQHRGVSVPHRLVEAADDEGRRNWLLSLPALIATTVTEWDLRVGDPFEPGGTCAWVAPAHTPELNDVVLKVAWRHQEAEHEAEGLREWNGAGAVRLHASMELDRESVALLLERCTPGTTLAESPEPEQDQVVAGLLHRLWRSRPFSSTFRPLRTMCDAWADEFERDREVRPLPVDAARAADGIALLRSLPASAADDVLLCTDLHAGNILAGAREPWLMIDPKPYVGDRAFDVLQHILNCQERLAADPVGLVRRMAGLCDLDPEHLARWLFARCVQESPRSPRLASIARRLAPP